MQMKIKNNEKIEINNDGISVNSEKKYNVFSICHRPSYIDIIFYRISYFSKKL